MNTREQILNRALFLFAHNGYDNVGIQSILDDVEVKKPTLYHYFGSKNGLLNEILGTHYKKLLKELKNCNVNPDDIVLTLENIVRVLFHFAEEHKEFFKLFFAASYAAENSEVKITNNSYYLQFYKFIEDFFIHLAKNRDNLKDMVTILTKSFIGTVTTYISLYLYEDFKLTDKLVYLVVKQFMYGIFSL
ncbi:MAG: TetR/AcrR family transcriptional regulator [Fibrobacter sp.]|nr:TetR/AcrR family transcriptional regulator [Fibrobacter sp.]